MPSFPQTTVKSLVTEAPVSVTEGIIVTEGMPDNSTEDAGNGQRSFEVSALLAIGASFLYNLWAKNFEELHDFGDEAFSCWVFVVFNKKNQPFLSHDASFTYIKGPSHRFSSAIDFQGTDEIFFSQNLSSK